MKHLAIFLLLTVSALAAVDLERLADCIKHVEAKANWEIGRNGERSSYQITRRVWEKYSTLTFESASAGEPWHREIGRPVALAHLQWLQRNVENPTVYRLALAWNAGATATNRCRINNRQADYATRVRNLYLEVKP